MLEVEAAQQGVSGVLRSVLRRERFVLASTVHRAEQVLISIAPAHAHVVQSKRLRCSA